MKKLLLLATLFCFSVISYGQVTGIDFILDYDSDDGITYYYNANLLINSGSATSISQRVQFNSQYTLVVSTGAEITVEENYMPLLNNSNYSGTEPIDWLINNITESPDITPDNDYVSITPNLDAATYHHNNLAAGDIIPLFRIAVSNNINCPNDVRLFENGVDPSSSEISGGSDHSNGFTIGAPNQLYSGNQPSNISITDISVNETSYTVCAGDCISISPDVICAPANITYLWSTGETTPTITVCPDFYEIYEVTINGGAGITANSSVSVEVDQDIIGFDEVDFFCVGSSYYPYSEFSNENWASSDESIASFDNGELLIHAEGTVTISNTSPAGCVTELDITTSPMPVIAFDGPSTICVNATTIVSANSGGVWFSDDPVIATVDNFGNITGVSPGTTMLTYVETATQCSATLDIPLTILPAPYIQNNGSNELCIGETTQMASENDGVWESSAPSVASIDNSGLVTAISPGAALFSFTEIGNNCSASSNSIIVSSNPEIALIGPSNICIGETTQLIPSTGGTWVSANPSIAAIDNTGNVTGTSEGTATLYFTSNVSGCTSLTSAPITVDLCMITPSLSCAQIQAEGVICDMDLLNNFVGVMPQEDSGGNQPDPLCADGGGPNNISWIAFVAPDGDYDITVTPTNCAGSITGQEGVQIGLYTNCSFTESVYCDPNCSTNQVSFDSSLFEIGQTYYFFIDGCFGSFCEYEIEISGNYISQCESACDDVITDTPWDYVPAGEFPSDIVIGSYTTGTNLLSTDDLDHLVYYEQVDGNIMLKENNGNGYLDNEILLFNNENHYGQGNYFLYLEDIDNDGLTDIILAESRILTMSDSGDEITVLQNMGNGNFTLQIKEQVCGMEGPNNLKIADYDNDGMKDIFFVCADFLYDILWINDWNDTELTNFNSQTFCHVYTGDFNEDGFQDIALSDDIALINNGYRTFSNSQFLAIESECNTLNYFVEETNTILGPYYASTVLDPSSLETQFCSEHYFGDNENEIFRAYITSPDVESIIIPQVEGFYFVDPNSGCDIYGSSIQVPNAVARQNTKIDLTLNGCTDFLVIEGDQIFAWINPKQSTKILGTAFIDGNANGIYDSNELPLRNVLVSIAPGDFSILTDDDGNYSFSVPPGTYTITANVNEGEWIQNELTIDNIQITEPCNEGYNFGFVPNSGPAEMATLSMVNTIARCDFETRFTITVENTGAEQLDAILNFNFDDQTTFFSSDIVGYQVVGNSVNANIGPLAPFSPQTYKIVVKMPSGSSNLPMLAFEAALYSQSGDLIEEYGYSDQLRCSYDPNDKREYPDREGEDNLTLMGEDIEYTIRFQNNGNDTAFQVKIVDPLDPSIDPSTIRVMNASHPLETCIEGTDLVFLFEDILLVDSTTNYPASQGFVTFRCNARDGLAEFTPTHNQADIIFDTNEPIVTNQTINTLVSVLCTDKQTTVEAEVCDGETYQGYTETGTYTETFELQYGCDSVVTIVLDVQEITYAQQNIQVCAGDQVTISGTSYTITESTAIIDTSFNENECISSILTYQIEAAPAIFEMVEDVNICLGEAFSFTPMEGSWVSNDPSVIIVDQAGSFTVTGAGSTTLTFIDNQFGCADDLPITVNPTPSITNTGSEQICINDSTVFVTAEIGTWTSENPSIGVINNDGIAIGLIEGVAGFTFTDSITGCSNNISLEVLPASDPMCTIINTVDTDKNQVKLYPNPASESIFIETDKLWTSIRIVDTQGKMVSTITQVELGKIEVNVSQYLSGVYLVIFQDTNKNLTKRFVVN